MLKNLLISSAFIFILYSLIIAGGDMNPHPFIASETSCVECHKIKKMTVTVNDTENACSYLCLTCHKDMDSHHAINLRLSEPFPAKFVLTSKNRVTCITCHRLKTNQYDTSSWKAESLYESIFNSKKIYKTYYLAKRNNDGQLCKTCH